MCASVQTPDSCRGFGGLRKHFAVNMPQLPTRLYTAHYNEHAAAPRRHRVGRVKRLSYEISGCVRSLNVTAPGKLLNILQAQAIGWHVDLYCVLETCHESEERNAGAQVEDFINRFHSLTGSSAFSNCTWWSRGQSILNSTTGKLKHEYRSEHPSYPYANRFPTTSVDHALSQFYKLRVLREMRSLKGPQYYDVVWRSRPDFISHGLNLSEFAFRDSHQYIVPRSCVYNPRAKRSLGQRLVSHTDIEAILPLRAAEHYSRMYDAIASLYKRKPSVFWPEFMLSKHMRLGGFSYQVAEKMILYRCSKFCFGPLTPCKRFPGSNCTLNATSSMFAGDDA